MSRYSSNKKPAADTRQVKSSLPGAVLQSDRFTAELKELISRPLLHHKDRKALQLIQRLNYSGRLRADLINQVVDIKRKYDKQPAS